MHCICSQLIYFIRNVHPSTRSSPCDKTFFKFGHNDINIQQVRKGGKNRSVAPTHLRIIRKCHSIKSLAYKHHYLFVYYFLTENGNYTQWSRWSSCSVTCGAGSRSRNRSCTNPPPGPYGDDCSRLGNDTETAECNNTSCVGTKLAVFM